MEYFVNLVFYHLFHFEKWSQRLISSPFVWFIKLPVIDRSFKKRGVENAEEEINRALYNPKVGANIVFANWHLTFLFYLIYFGAFNFLIGFLWRDLYIFENKYLWVVFSIFVIYFSAWISVETLVAHKKNI